VGGFWVYILECADSSYYTGFTTDLVRRLSEHNRGVGGKYTTSRRPVRVLWSCRCDGRREAMSVERHIKGLTRRQKREVMELDEVSLRKLLAGWKRRRRKRPSENSKKS